MGSGSWNPSEWTSHSTATVTKTVDKIFASKKINNLLNPFDVVCRESRDSADHPESTPIIVALDVTGSMGMIAEQIAKIGLGVLFNEILDRKPVSDPQLMFMAVGDINYDQAPLQVSQFESDNRIVDQLEQIYLESGGGGNNSESYNLPWYFAGFHTSTDAFEKRNKKGYLFTIGDECVPRPPKITQLKNLLNSAPQAELTNEEILKAAERMYHVFHVNVEEGNHNRHHLKETRESWNEVLSQRVIPLSDYTSLSEVIVSVIEVTEGAEKDAVAASWSGKTAKAVGSAIANLPSVVKSSSPAGIIKLS